MSCSLYLAWPILIVFWSTYGLTNMIYVNNLIIWIGIALIFVHLYGYTYIIFCLFQMVLQNCSELKCLNLPFCKKLSQEGFAALVDNVEHLEKLDVSFTAVCFSLPVYWFSDNYNSFKSIFNVFVYEVFQNNSNIFISNPFFF